MPMFIMGGLRFARVELFQFFFYRYKFAGEFLPLSVSSYANGYLFCINSLAAIAHALASASVKRLVLSLK